MSFSSEQKEMIIFHNYKSSCCRRALLSGILFSKGFAGSDVVTIHIEKQEFAEFAVKLIKEFYTKNVEVYRDNKGGRYVVVSFLSESAANYIANIADGEFLTQKCSGCLQAFLKGVFFASGKVSDPAKQYLMEFSLGDRSIFFADFLSEYGIIPLISYKKSGTIAYFKSSTMIENFSAAAGMNSLVFAILNAKAEGELRQNVGRRTNCETNNIAKSIDAATKQLNVIKRLEELNLLSSLPEELESTARLRLEYTDLSLSQLSQVAVPPISKPGLSHRLKKIIELGEQLLEDKK